MNQTVKTSAENLIGTVAAPPSKSAAHRAIICAALAKGSSCIHNISSSKDILATCKVLTALGAQIQEGEGSCLHVDGSGMFTGEAALCDCNESGSTLRFLIPVAAAGGVPATFTGSGRLPERPIGLYTELLPKHGAECLSSGGLPLRVNGKLQAGVYELAGNISSQFITGLMLALPLLEGESQIKLTTPLESRGYVDLTLEILGEFGIDIQPEQNGWRISGGQAYKAQSFTVEGDWSQAAFFMAAGALGGNTAVGGLRPDSVQGDRACLELFKAFGAQVSFKNGTAFTSGSALHGIDIDASQIPDLVPILAVTAALAQGKSRIYGAERLRIKESDRLSAIANALNAAGGRVTVTADGLLIEGVKSLNSCKVEGCNDHRIVMAMSVAAIKADGFIEITDAMSINKSYPRFFEDFKQLGGTADVINLG